jgi:hypothetical protein
MGVFSKSDRSGSEDPPESKSSGPEPPDSEAQRSEGDASQQQPAELIALSNIQRALATVENVEDIKQIRDKAEAVRKYIASAGLGLEVQNKASELKLRAERKAGEMLAEMKLHGGDRRSDESGDRLRLDDLGISKDQSSRWQLLARVPAKLFDEFVSQFLVRRVELTTAEALRFARSMRAQTKGSADDSGAAISAQGATLETLAAASKKFGCIYAAPPLDGSGALTTEQLCELPIGRLAADQAHLHLWTTNEQSSDANRIVEAWGFVPRDILVWVKPKRGPGDYWRRSHELLMLGVRGDCPFADKTIQSWIKANRPRGGGKPACIRELVEAVSPGPYVELFTDKSARGWQACTISAQA